MNTPKLNDTKNQQTISGEMSRAVGHRKLSKFDQILSILPFSFRSTKPVVAVLRLDGIIGKVSAYRPGLSLASLNKIIEDTFKINNLVALCICVNSPGGSPVQSELIAHRITALADKHQVPVYTFVEEVAASGGYWLACMGDKIFASKSSIIGSIGVIFSNFGFDKAIKKLGIERRIFTEGDNKSVLDPFEPVKASDVTIIKNLGRNIHEHFIDYVKARRAGRLTQSDDILFNGEFWTGQIALDYGLIDGIDNLYSYITRHYGSEVRIEYIESKQSWLKKKLGLSHPTNLGYEISEGLVEALKAEVAENRFKID